MRVANIVLTRCLTANNATCKPNNVHLTTMDAQQFSMAAIYPSYIIEKLTYQRQEIMTQKQERFMQTEIYFSLGKNGGYMPSSLGSRLISVGRQAVSERVRQKFLQFYNFNLVNSKP